ncbi:MAG: ribosome recycling factor [Planctomycetes bacterium]|nr:ribosome recycling factor [Planctomycetota bacterium]
MVEDGGKQILKDVEDRMVKAVAHLKDELRGIRTGRAVPALVDNVRVDYYGSPTPLNQLAQISAPEARQLLVKPFDTKALADIERAVLKADLGMTPNSDGKVLRLNLPVLSEEQRKKLAHRVKDIGETARVSLRNVRRDGNKHVETAKKDGLSEDQAADLADRVQEFLKKHEAEIDAILKSKTEEIMTV